MTKPKLVATIQYSKNANDWVLHNLHTTATARFKKLVHALKQADDMVLTASDAITVHHKDRSIELILSPVDLLAAVLRNS